MSAAPASHIDPAWSPDGKRIAFVNYASGKSAIYLINSDGTGLRRLTRPRRRVASPTWSPDGRRIAFSDANGVFVMNSNGRGLRSIGAAIGWFGNVEWGPGGEKIAFQVTGMNFDDPTIIYVVNPDGSGQQVAADPSDTFADDAYRAPTWSPDGERLLFTVAKIDAAGIEGVKSFLGVIDSFAGPVRDLLRGDYSWYPNPHQVPLDVRGWDPDWSPDGRRIAMSGVGVLTLSTHRFRLLHEDGFSPDWSPDGRKIVFVKRGDPPGASERIYVMNADGSNVRLLTH